MVEVYIAILNQGNIRVEVANALVKMSMDKRFSKIIKFPNDKPAAHNRNKIVLDFLETTADFLLVIDDDNPPLKNPLDLVELDKDVIACPTPGIKDGKIDWLVMDKVGENEWRPIDTKKRKGLREVDAISSGCMLIARRVLEKVKEPFVRKWKDGLAVAGLDFYFCEKAKKEGFKVWANWNYPCDHYKTVNLIGYINSIIEAKERGERNWEQNI